MTATGYIVNAALVGAVVVAFGGWFYMAYHSMAAARAYWHSMPSFRSALREFFWPDIKDATRSHPYPPDFIIHRNKARRGVAAFLMAWLFAFTTGLIGALTGQMHTPQSKQPANPVKTETTGKS